MRACPWPTGLWVNLLIGAALTACGDGGTNADAGGDQDAAASDAVRLDATNPDATATDAGPVDTGPQPDSGPIDGGACGCSYGYHHECSQGQTCQLGFGPPLPQQPPSMCVATGTISSGLGGACTSTTGHTPGSCNAQCVAEAAGSPCKADLEYHLTSDTIAAWSSAMHHASDPQSTLWNPMTEFDIRQARGQGVSAACAEYLGWTVLGLLELCRGEGTITHPDQWGHIQWREFRGLDPNGCQYKAGGLCIAALIGIVTSRNPDATPSLNEFGAVCPNGLPLGEACRGPNAVDCIRAHIQMIARTLP